MNWHQFNKRHDLERVWKQAKEKTEEFMEEELSEYDFEDGNDPVDFIEEEYCYERIFHHFLGEES